MGRPGVKALLPMLVLAVAAGCRQAPPPKPAGAPPAVAQAPADWREQARAAYERGVLYLVRTQNKDGSWGDFGSARPFETWLEDYMAFEAYYAATTALCVMALQEPLGTVDWETWGKYWPGEHLKINPLVRGVDYLLQAKSSFRTSGDVLYDNWAHLYVTYALSILARDPRLTDRREKIVEVVKREIGRLAQQQGADGGWGYYDFGWAQRRPSGMESTSFMTAGVVVALDEARKSGIEFPERLVRDGLRVVERLRIGNGAYNYGNPPNDPVASFNDVKGSIGRSQVCNLALWRSGRVVTKDDLRRGLENLFKYHHFIEIGRGRPIPHEAWYSTAGYYYLFAHYYAAKVLDELDPEDRARWSPVLAKTLIDGQDPGGSWLDFPMYQFGQPYGTAFALLALEVCLEEEK
ncbi:MAG: prenyltransferase/squalene oxidase repeat-containing protein [Planctomycetota bacterium]